MSSTEQQNVSPQLYFETLNAYQKSMVLKGAMDLDLFTAIAEGNTTISALATHCEASERGVRILCDTLVVLGFLTKADASYGLTSDTAVFLDRNSPAYAGGAVRFMLSPTIRAAFDDIAATVRKGGTTLPDDGTVSVENEVWIDFARGMGAMMMPAAQFIAGLLALGEKKVRILDIAAGHGIYGVTLLQSAPNAEVVALDWPGVLEVASENAALMGVAERHSTIAGSVFDVDLGSGYDIVLLTNFLHHFDPPTCVALLEKVRASLAPDGRVVTVEFVPNPDRVSPPDAARFSMTMLASTPAGDAYTMSELEKMFTDAGFASSEQYLVPPGIQSVVVSSL